MLRTSLLSALLGVLAVPISPLDVNVAAAQPVYTPQHPPVVGPCSQRTKDAWKQADRILDSVQHISLNVDYNVVNEGPDDVFGTADDFIDKSEAKDFETDEMMPFMFQVDELAVDAIGDAGQILLDSTYWLDHGNPEFADQLYQTYHPLAVAEQQSLATLYARLRAICAAMHACDLPGLKKAVTDFDNAKAAYDAGC